MSEDRAAARALFINDLFASTLLRNRRVRERGCLAIKAGFASPLGIALGVSRRRPLVAGIVAAERQQARRSRRQLSSGELIACAVEPRPIGDIRSSNLAAGKRPLARSGSVDLLTPAQARPRRYRRHAAPRSREWALPTRIWKDPASEAAAIEAFPLALGLHQAVGHRV